MMSSTPPATPQPAFTSISAATCRSDFTYRNPSSRSPRPVTDAHPAGRFTAGGSALKLVRPMMTADARNDTAFTRNAASRPSSAVTMPPAPAPMASMADHVALESAFAVSNSERVVTLGMTAVRAGSKNAVSDTTVPITR